MTNGILCYDIIHQNAKAHWNEKTATERLKNGAKYKHIFAKYGFKCMEWSNDFDGLSKRQKNILVKGELIRTYDKLTNEEKANVKGKYKLGKFSSKWFKLSPQDKSKLLKSILYNAKRKKAE